MGSTTFEEELIDVTVHKEAAFACNVVPRNVNACKFTARPVGGDGIICLKGMEEVVSMVAPGVLNAKIVDNEDKGDWMPIVSPETRCGRHPRPLKPQLAPHHHRPIIYGAKEHLIPEADTTPPLDDEGIKRIQGIMGSLLYSQHHQLPAG